MVNIAVVGICGMSHFMRTDHFHQKGETLKAYSYEQEIGGKGINQAVAAARMGAKVSYLGAIGNDADGELCQKVAKENKINGFFAAKEEHTPIAYILTDKTGENQVTEFLGAELSKEDVLNFEEEISKCDILLIQQEVPFEVNSEAVRLAKKYNKKVILNPAPAREITPDLTQNVFLITPNVQEAQNTDLSKFEHYIITQGDKGCLIDGKINVPSLNVTPVDTTGAGDTFNGVLAVCVAEGMTFEEACRYAVTASGISVTKKMVLNSIPYRKEIEECVKL